MSERTHLTQSRDKRYLEDSQGRMMMRAQFVGFDEPDGKAMVKARPSSPVQGIDIGAGELTYGQREELAGRLMSQDNLAFEDRPAASGPAGLGVWEVSGDGWAERITAPEPRADTIQGDGPRDLDQLYTPDSPGWEYDNRAPLDRLVDGRGSEYELVHVRGLDDEGRAILGDGRAVDIGAGGLDADQRARAEEHIKSFITNDPYESACDETGYLVYLRTEGEGQGSLHVVNEHTGMRYDWIGENINSLQRESDRESDKEEHAPAMGM